MPLNLCICGWYFNDDWYASLLRLQQKEVTQVHIVANKIHPLLEVCGLPYTVRENTGLEWGAYNHYLSKIWDGGDTVFAHDDMAFEPVMTADHKVVSGEDLFHRLGNLRIDQGYIFNSRQDDAENWGKHGRMLFMSHGLIDWVGNIWFDQDNSQNYNAGINAFEELMKKAERHGFDVRNKIYFPGIAHGYRGEFKGRVIK